MNCFATVCTWNQSLYYSKRSTVCIAQQKHDRTQNDISHIGLTSMVLCHGVQKLEQNRWFRPESFRSPRNACNSSRSFVASFNFARTVSANRYGMLIKIPPSVLHQAFHGTKLLDRMVLTNICIYLRMLHCSYFFSPRFGLFAQFLQSAMWSYGIQTRKKWLNANWQVFDATATSKEVAGTNNAASFRLNILFGRRRIGLWLDFRY